MAQQSRSRKLDQYIVRFPDGLRDRIKAAAEANKRSMNQEIVATLLEKYPEPRMSMQDWINEFVIPFSKEQDKEKSRAIAKQANEIARRYGWEMRLSSNPEEGEQNRRELIGKKGKGAE